MSSAVSIAMLSLLGTLAVAALPAGSAGLPLSARTRITGSAISRASGSLRFSGTTKVPHSAS